MLKVSENLQLNMLPKSQKATRKLESYLRSNLLQYLKCAFKKKNSYKAQTTQWMHKIIKTNIEKKTSKVFLKARVEDNKGKCEHPSMPLGKPAYSQSLTKS